MGPWIAVLPVHVSLQYLDHRPWPLPEGAWWGRQTWRDLAFIHWEIRPDQIQALLPDSLEVDTFDGTAWIGLVPFDMRDVTLRRLPAFPPVSNFPELNVRTYVKHRGKPGVWFFSLDVPNPIAVWIARRFFHLPYYRAAMRSERQGDAVAYLSERADYRFDARYAPRSGQRVADTSFARWATERYCLYGQAPQGQLYCGEIHHAPWPLVPAELEISTNSYLDDYSLGPRHPEVLFSRELHVVVWSLDSVGDCI